ncbi:TPA: hypothetical protein ACROKA_002807, partial [Staphylococcus aureus]
CQILFYTLKTIKNTVKSTLKRYFEKERYFYIVSRQEETRFQLVSKTFQKPSIHKNTTRMTLKIQDYN